MIERQHWAADPGACANPWDHVGAAETIYAKFADSFTARVDDRGMLEMKESTNEKSYARVTTVAEAPVAKALG